MQWSSYIRCAKELINPIREPVKYRELRDYDLSLLNIKNLAVLKEARELTDEQSIILYSFFHHNGDHKIMHSYAITDCNHNLLYKKVIGSTLKSILIMNEAIKYIAN